MTDQIARIHIALEDMEPVIWRRVELPLSNSLKTLHLAIQAVMLFEHYHLFRFDVGEASYGIPFDDDYMDPPTRDAANIRLAKLVERGVTAFTYTYDFGDDWRHSIEIEGVFPADPAMDYPRFVDGERRAPPEDVGGLPGFEALLDAMAKPRHPSRKSMLQWNGRPFAATTSAPTKSTLASPNSPSVAHSAKQLTPTPNPSKPEQAGGLQATLAIWPLWEA